MGSELKCVNCESCKSALDLMELKVKDLSTIHDDRVSTYRGVIKDRELELIKREIEVIGEIDTLKNIISILEGELENRGCTLSTVGGVLTIKDKYNVDGISHVVNPYDKSGVLKDSNRNKKSKEVCKEKVKVSSKEKVKKTDKVELNNTENLTKTSIDGIILPSMCKLSADESRDLMLRGVKLKESILIATKDVDIKDGGYPIKRELLYKKYSSFFIAMVLLVESVPKSRGSYAWSTVTNILKEDALYRDVASAFLLETGFKLTYMNIRNWYMYLIQLVSKC